MAAQAVLRLGMQQKMRFAVVGERREWSEPVGVAEEGATIRPNAVEAEARRRKTQLHLDEWQMREYVTGRPVPENVQQLCRQIELAAEALIRMQTIPADFADDLYWPRQW